MSDSPYAHYGTLDPEYQAAHQPVSLPQDIEEARKFINDVLIPTYRAKSLPHLPEASTYQAADHSVPVAGGTGKIQIRTVVPVAQEGAKFPVFYWVHGGAFMFGSYKMLEPLLTILSVELQVALVLVDYRLAPEHPHPVPVDDSYEGLKWTVNNAESLNIDVSKGFIIGGDSAGACLTAVLTHLARDDPFFDGKQPTGQILAIPCAIDPRAYPEQYKAELRSIDMTENVEYASLLRPFIFHVYENVLRNEPTDPKASPLLFPSHANLPPAVLQIAGLDLLRDEGILYDKVLREAGVKTKLHVYPGVSHGFHTVYTEIKAAHQYEDDFKAGLKWLLAGAKE